MTSPATHDETVSFFHEHDRFGLAADDLRIFCQGTMPAVDNQGQLLLEAKDRIFRSPDGHGGMLAALKHSGGLAAAQAMGLEELFYFQVDNPLVSICDRELVGFHSLANSDMSTLVVAKQEPEDKVGNVVSLDGRLRVIEYSDLPRAAAGRRDVHGNLLLWAGSIAVHVFRVEFFSARPNRIDRFLSTALVRKCPSSTPRVTKCRRSKRTPRSSRNSFSTSCPLPRMPLLWKVTSARSLLR